MAHQVLRQPTRLGHVRGLRVRRAGRGVAALRRIGDIHKPNANDDCIVCGWDDGYEDIPNESYPCATLRAVASMWAGHPDYDTTWEQG